MKLFGLIGYPLSHSFSKQYFTGKFKDEELTDCEYELFEIKSADFLPELIAATPSLVGLNVTIPHKQAVIPFLDSLDPIAEKVGAVNVIKFVNDSLVGYNSDYYGFRKSLESIISSGNGENAMVLGTGGASKAVITVLEDLGFEVIKVSRTKRDGVYTYNEIQSGNHVENSRIIVNTTPLGMYPEIKSCPDIPYSQLSKGKIAFDLVYNPEASLFLKKSAAHGAITKNGFEMLTLQAEKSWEIWNA